MIYLASQSPRRKKILRELGISFRVVKSKYDEEGKKREKEGKRGKKKGLNKFPKKFDSPSSSFFHLIPSSSPGKIALQHAIGKAKAAIAPKSARFILGADTVVCVRKKILGKPKSKREALQMLGLLSGKSHAVYTALALLDRKTNKIWKGCANTKVYVKHLSLKEMENYIHKTHPYDKAGGYAIQEKPCIVEKIAGSYSNVVGLPAELLRKLLQSAVSRRR